MTVEIKDPLTIPKIFQNEQLVTTVFVFHFRIRFELNSLQSPLEIAMKYSPKGKTIHFYYLSIVFEED